MKPIANDFGPVALPPTDPRYVNGASGHSKLPSVTGLKLDAARKRLQDAGFQVADQPTPINSYSSKGAVVGTTPKDQSRPRLDHHDQHEQRGRTGAGVHTQPSPRRRSARHRRHPRPRHPAAPMSTSSTSRGCRR